MKKTETSNSSTVLHRWLPELSIEKDATIHVQITMSSKCCREKISPNMIHELHMFALSRYSNYTNIKHIRFVYVFIAEPRFSYCAHMLLLNFGTLFQPTRTQMVEKRRSSCQQLTNRLKFLKFWPIRVKQPIGYYFYYFCQFRVFPLYLW